MNPSLRHPAEAGRVLGPTDLSSPLNSTISQLWNVSQVVSPLHVSISFWKERYNNPIS